MKFYLFALTFLTVSLVSVSHGHISTGSAALAQSETGCLHGGKEYEFQPSGGQLTQYGTCCFDSHQLVYEQFIGRQAKMGIEGFCSNQSDKYPSGTPVEIFCSMNPPSPGPSSACKSGEQHAQGGLGQCTPIPGPVMFNYVMVCD